MWIFIEIRTKVFQVNLDAEIYVKTRPFHMGWIRASSVLFGEQPVSIIWGECL
jgi:hypothetical protein